MTERSELYHDIKAASEKTGKVSKQKAGYSAGKPRAHCGPEGRFGKTGACEHYRRGACELVAGIISPDNVVPTVERRGMTVSFGTSTLKAMFGSEEKFRAAVDAFIADKKAHQRTVGVPAPVPSHPSLEACVKRVPVEGQADDFVADYEIIDDTPPPPPAPTLRQRKDALIAEVLRLEGAALAEILPPGKQRLAAVRANEIARADSARASDTSLRRQAILAKAQGERTGDEVAFLGASEDLGKFVAAGRSAEDTAFLEAQASRAGLNAAVERHAAELMHEIEDLTEETIAAWAPRPFPKP